MSHDFNYRETVRIRDARAGTKVRSPSGEVLTLKSRNDPDNTELRLCWREDGRQDSVHEDAVLEVVG